MILLTTQKASKWASDFTGRDVTTANISYLVQYGKVRKFGSNGNLFVAREDLESYYRSELGRIEIDWKKKLGDDLNWVLSFDNYKESERTKHVHRLHPYKGKFIPQLVEYFLDAHTDEFKKEIYFKPGDIILDPFCGSGTTLVQANELGMHAIGLDISEFNTLISNVKLYKYDLLKLNMISKTVSRQLNEFLSEKEIISFDEELLGSLAIFNNKHFPVPEFRYRADRGEIDEEKYGSEKAKQFLPLYLELLKKHKIELENGPKKGFLDVWYLKPIREEITFINEIVNNIADIKMQNIVRIILSRTIRSCRATTHSDLATLISPVKTTYYCTKHKKICKPLFSIKKWWDKYSEDTIERLGQFDRIRTTSNQICLVGDSRNLDIISELRKMNKELARLVKQDKIRGIFTSPPYVGLIDYHEQHAYAYDLFGFERRDEMEIGPLRTGSGAEARKAYVEAITAALSNCKKYLQPEADVFIVANDKFDLYPHIASESGLRIVNKFRRPVLNRTEKSKGAYSESIFHLREE